jgi:hypothetical protein
MRARRTRPRSGGCSIGGRRVRRLAENHGTALRHEGVMPARARRLAALVVASHGRNGRDVPRRAQHAAADDVRQELELVLSSALSKLNRRGANEL